MMQLMAHVERRPTDVGCPKLNLQIRASNDAVLEFYRQLGYVRDEAVSLGKRLIPDDAPPGRPRPTTE
jgi:ribosomal protein S18 acetylase RimI-like enzyme